MLRILYIAYMVDISRAKSATIKGISRLPSTVKSFLWFDLVDQKVEYWSIDYEFAGIDTGEEAFTIACGGLSAITSKRSRLFLLMTLSSRLPQVTIRYPSRDGTNVV